MKKSMRILAISMTLALAGTTMPVSAAPVAETVTETSIGAFSLSNWWNSLWSGGKAKEDKNSEKNTEKNNGTSSKTDSEKETEDTDAKLELVEDESTVEEGTELRASTYALEDTKSAKDTTLKYFPVTMYDYDKTTFNNAVHQTEVDAALQNGGIGTLTKWNGIYFGDGKGTESYTYSTGGEASYSAVTVQANYYSEYSKYENSGYYVDIDGEKKLVTKITSWFEYSGWEYKWTVTYNGGEQGFSGSSITLYKSNNTATTNALSYADHNKWTGELSGNNGNQTYSGIAKSTLDANKNILFNYPDAGLFDDNATIKKIYTNVGLPFEYDSTTGYYDFDANRFGAYFHKDDEQGTSGTPASNTNLYYSTTPQSHDFSGQDQRTRGWFPYDDTTNVKSASANYYFGMNATIPFTMTANGRMNPNNDESEPIKFEFSGDDDVWVFIDGQLVLDIGGCRNGMNGTLDFASNTWNITEMKALTGKTAGDINGKDLSGTIFNDSKGTGTLNQTRETFAATDSHELTIFYLERGAGSSNCKIMFNLPMKDTVSVTKRATQSISSDGTVSPLTAAEQATVDKIDFGFTLTKNGTPVANTNYNLMNANGQVVSTPSTDTNGHFTLRNGQTARFVGEIAKDGAAYQVAEDAVEAKGFKLPTYTYSGTAAGGYTVGDDSYSGGSDIPSTTQNLTGAAITAKGSDEAEDSLQFVCENYFDANLPNPSSCPVDDQIVIDYGLPVVIDVLSNDVYRGDKIELTEVTGAQYGTAIIENGKITYQLTEQLSGVEVLTYTATVTGSGNSGTTTTTETESNTAKVYIIPATSMYYEENFSNMVTYTDNWSNEGSAQTDSQEPGVVGTVGDSPYGSDVAYLNDSGDSNGSSKYVNTAQNRGAGFSYTFTGTGTSFFARTTNNSGYIKVQIKQGENVICTRYRDTSYKTKNNETTLYNIPVFTYEADNYGTYTVDVSIANPTDIYGTEFWLDGIRVINPLNSEDINKDVAYEAYAKDEEANMTVATLREKLLKDVTIDDENGTLQWDGVNFVVFTDSKGEVQTAEEYKSNGPKEEVYLDKEQSVTFSLNNWDVNSNKIYLGIKAPMGSGSVDINGHSLDIHNAADCYYNISEFRDITMNDGVPVATFRITATSGIISVTNIKVTGSAEFTIVNGTDINLDVEDQSETLTTESEEENREAEQSDGIESESPAVDQLSEEETPSVSEETVEDEQQLDNRLAEQDEKTAETELTDGEEN